MTSYWPPLVALCLTGLGLEDSPLVILSLCSLAPSYVLSIFSFLYLYTLSFPFIFFSLPYVFLHKVVFLNINLYYLSKKKSNLSSTSYNVHSLSGAYVSVNIVVLRI